MLDHRAVITYEEFIQHTISVGDTCALLCQMFPLDTPTESIDDWLRLNWEWVKTCAVIKRYNSQYNILWIDNFAGWYIDHKHYDVYDSLPVYDLQSIV